MNEKEKLKTFFIYLFNIFEEIDVKISFVK